MKLAGISGKGRGRLGTMVFSSSAGEQIVRQYQPNVSNPNTAAQVAQRAKFKLMAQVAAAVSGEIIIPRDGLQSPRNLFQKKNFGLVSTSGDTATLQYEGLQFTAGNVAIPAISATRDANGISVALAAAANVSRVVYLAYRKSAQGTLQFASSTIVDTAGDANTFPTTLADINGEAVIYAYGMRDLSASATAKYGNYSVSDGTALATLVLSRTLSSSDYQFTRTTGTTVESVEPVVQGINNIIIKSYESSESTEYAETVIRNGDSLVNVEYASHKYSFDISMNLPIDGSPSVDLVYGVSNTPLPSEGYLDGPLADGYHITGSVLDAVDTREWFVEATDIGVRVDNEIYKISFTRV